MTELLHHLIRDTADTYPDTPAVRDRHGSLTYSQLWERVKRVAGGLHELGLESGSRVAIQLPKTFDNVVFMFAAAAAGCVFVPISPVLKSHQVLHILRDSGARLLLTNSQRTEPLLTELRSCPNLLHIVLSDGAQTLPESGLNLCTVGDISASVPLKEPAPSDLAAIFYTSGSTGLPKGVMLSHRNLVIGAESVNGYLHNTPMDRILALLPFSFDYGFSQLTIAFAAGAQVVLMEYLLPRLVVQAIERYQITALAGVPVMWNQLAQTEWTEGAWSCLRYLCNSGGSMAASTTQKLQEFLPDTAIYLMYGLTEAFRSTYLDPMLVDAHPDSIGRAIPNAEIHVVRPDGTECGTNEPGELVHLGPLVAQGYWNAPQATAKVFRDWHGRHAVWSGDKVVRDQAGLLYFLGRKDEMIKTSGYRVSPSEIESVALQETGVGTAVALGISDALLGQSISLFIEGQCDLEQLKARLHRELPSYMQPTLICCMDKLPLTPNGKPDRASLLDLRATS